MEKWEEHLIKQNSKEIPESVELTIIQTLQSLPPKKRYRTAKFAFITIAIALSTLLSVSFINPTFAETFKDLPIINTITDFVDDIGMKNGYEQGISTPINEQYKVDDMKVEFTEVVYDGTDVYIGYLVSQARLERQERVLGDDIRVRVDGKEIGRAISIYGERIDDMLYAGRLKVKPVKPLPDQFMLQLDFKGESVEIAIEKKGNTDIYVTTTSKQQDDLKINYKSVSFTPTATIINLDLITDITFNELVNFIVKDDKGNVLELMDYSGTGTYKDYDEEKKSLNHLTISYEPINDRPSYLTIEPYLYSEPNEPKINNSEWEDEPLTLTQGALGAIHITDVIRKNGEVSVHYTFDSKDKNRTEDNLRIHDEKDIYYYADSITQVGVNKYKKIFKGFPGDSLIVFATTEVPNYQYFEELKVRIPLTEVR